MVIKKVLFCESLNIPISCTQLGPKWPKMNKNMKKVLNNNILFLWLLGDGKKVCKDIDECKKGHKCHKNAECKNKPGTYECLCNTGYTGKFL